MRLVALVPVNGTLEDDLTADPLDEVHPDRVTPLGQLPSGHWYTRLTNAGFQCIPREQFVVQM